MPPSPYEFWLSHIYGEKLPQTHLSTQEEGVLILGTADNPVYHYLKNKIEAAGCSVTLFDTTTFPQYSRLTFMPFENESVNMVSLKPDLAYQFRSGYYLWHNGYNHPYEDDCNLSSIVYLNVLSAIESFLQCADFLWVNPPTSVAMHKKKAYQLKLLHEAGIRVPLTLVTNDPEAILAFYEKLQGQVVVKPTYTGAYATKLEPKHLTRSSLAKLTRNPVQLQELITGVDHRAYVVHHEVFTISIKNAQLDYRDGDGAIRTLINLDAHLDNQLRLVAKTLGLLFTGIDFKLTPDHELVVFEANPSPYFIGDDQVSEGLISQALVNLLLNGRDIGLKEGLIKPAPQWTVQPTPQTVPPVFPADDNDNDNDTICNDPYGPFGKNGYFLPYFDDADVAEERKALNIGT